MKSVSRVCALLCIATLKVFCLARLGAAFSAFIAQEELSLLYVNTTFASDVEGHMVYILDGGTCATLANSSLQLSGTGTSLPPFPSTASVLNINVSWAVQEQPLLYEVSADSSSSVYTIQNNSVPVSLNCPLPPPTIASFDVTIVVYYNESNQSNTTCHFQVQKLCDVSNVAQQLATPTSSYASGIGVTVMSSLSSLPEPTMATELLSLSIVVTQSTLVPSLTESLITGSQPTMISGVVTATATGTTQSPQPSVSTVSDATQSPQPSVSTVSDVNATQSPQPSVSTVSDVNATQSLQPSVSTVSDATQSPQPSVSTVSDATQNPQPSVSTVSDATQSPQPSVSTVSDATQSPQPSVSTVSDVNATQSPQPSVSTVSDATQSPQPSVSTVSDVNATQSPQPSVSTVSDATQSPQPSVSTVSDATQSPQPSVSTASDVNATQNPQPSVSTVSNATQSLQPSVSTVSDATQNLQPSVSTVSDATQSPQPSVSTVSDATQSLQPSVSTVSDATQNPQPSVSTVSNATQSPQPSVSTVSYATQSLQPSVSTVSDVNATQSPQPSVSTVSDATQNLQPYVSTVSNATQSPQPSVSTVSNATQNPQPSVSTVSDVNATQNLQPSVSTVSYATQSLQPSVSTVSDVNATQNPQPSVSTVSNATQNLQSSVSTVSNATQSPQPSVSTVSYATQSLQPSVSTVSDVNATQSPKPSVSTVSNATQNPQSTIAAELPTVNMLSGTYLVPTVDQSSTSQPAVPGTPTGVLTPSSLPISTSGMPPVVSTFIEHGPSQTFLYATFLTSTASPGPTHQDDIQMVYILAFAPVVGVSSLLACLLVLCIGCVSCRRKKRRSVSFEDDPHDVVRVASTVEEDNADKKAEVLVSLWMPLSWGYVAHLPLSAQAVIRRYRVDRRSLTIPSTIVPEADGCVVNGQFSERVSEHAALQQHAVSMKLLIRLKEGSHYEEVARFVEHATFFRGITHPNIMSIICLSMEDNYVPIAVYPSTRDGNLHTLLTAHRLQPDDRSLTPITSAMKVSFCQQIAVAMTFISDHNLIHPDLALRNCLLDTDYVVKVGDDALSTDLFPECYQEILGAVRPVRWSAPETLQEGLCTIKSNVWSFGVTMWEIMAMGEMPYSDVPSNKGILSFLMMQGRLEKPSGCKEDMYCLMASCWTAQGERRPHFSSLHNQLESILGTYSGTHLDQSFPLSPDQQLTYSTFGKSLADEQKPIYVSMEVMTLGRGGSVHGKAPPTRVPIRESPELIKEQILSPQDDHVSVTFSVLSGDVPEEGHSDEEDGGGGGEEGDRDQDLQATITPQVQYLPPEAGRLMNSSCSTSTPVAPKRSASSDQYGLSSFISGVSKQQPPFTSPQGAPQVPMVQLFDLGSKFDSSSSTLTTTSPTPLLQDSHKSSSFFSGSTAQMSPYVGPTPEATSHFMPGPTPLQASLLSADSAHGHDQEAKLRGTSPKLRGASPLSVTHRLSSAHDRLSSVEGGAKSTDSGIRSGDETGGSVTPTPSGDNREGTPTPSGGDMESEGVPSRLSRNSFGLDSGLTDMTDDIMSNFAKKVVTLRPN